MLVIHFDISREILCGKLVNVLKLSIVHTHTQHILPDLYVLHILLFLSVFWYFIAISHTHQHTTTVKALPKIPHKYTHTYVCVCVCVKSRLYFSPVNVIYGHDNSIWHCADYNECECGISRRYHVKKISEVIIYLLHGGSVFDDDVIILITFYIMSINNAWFTNIQCFFLVCLFMMLNWVDKFVSPYKFLISLSIKKGKIIH